MLVLTRKVDQSIMIGEEIRIVVVDVRGDQVKIGIDAPRDIMVHRHEIYQGIQEENQRISDPKGMGFGVVDSPVQDMTPPR